MNAPVSKVVRSTPNVDSTMPGLSTGRMSAYFVSMPPEKRMMLNAIIPMNWASDALWNCSPSPSLPNSMPTTRKSSKVGIPNR